MTSANTAGQIGIDLTLNNNNFENNLRSTVSGAFNGLNSSNVVGNAMSKIGKIAGAIFSAAVFGSFIKDSIELGSNLAEVQNVVDVAFGEMSAAADEWASHSIKDFGMSETTAKRMLGTFGSMAKSFGYTTEQALGMSEQLVGLAGDVSSFYNISQDAAYTKLKSVFTGETESLKDLGVVMTQTALDEFALANGFGKTTSAMNEQEKVALRLKFVTAQLNSASGDFVRTQDSWANQTRILTEQWNAFKAQIGQAFIQVLTPIIKALNMLMEKLIALAKIFNQFTASIFGKQDTNSISGAASDMADLTSATNEQTTAQKKLNKSLMGFDELNKLADNSSTGGGGGAGIGSFGDFGAIAEAGDETNNLNGALDELKAKLDSIFKNFKNGFDSVFKVSELDEIALHIKNIGKTLAEIFNSEEVKSGIQTFTEKVSYALGQIVGSIASIGATMGTFLFGSLDKYLTKNKGRLTDRIADMFGTAGDLWAKMGDYAAAISEIFSVFRSETAQEIGSNILEMFINPLTDLADVLLKFETDVFDVVTGPIVENVDLIKESFNGLLETLLPVSETFATMMSDWGQNIVDLYDNHVHPFMQSLKDGLTEISETCLKAWNENIKPVLDQLAERFSTVYSEHLKPAMDKTFEVLGKIIDILKILWENVLEPLYNWIAENVYPVVSVALDLVGNVVLTTIGFIGDQITALMTSLGGLLDFITGVFTGDWKKAWNGVKDIFKGVFDSLVGIVKQPINLIIDLINTMIKGINKALHIKAPDWAGGAEWGVNIPEIPHLANGGYVAANTPQLALIGDNRREGEIVAPESKITEAVNAALVPTMNALIQALQNKSGGDIIIPVSIDGRQLDEVIVNAQSRTALRNGGI